MVPQSLVTETDGKMLNICLKFFAVREAGENVHLDCFLLLRRNFNFVAMCFFLSL